MLVIRIAIIRIAAAGVVWSRADICEGILSRAKEPVNLFVSLYIHMWMLDALRRARGGQKQESRSKNGTLTIVRSKKPEGPADVCQK
jgi:hypothetical protein